jgi:hypothetical protein
MEAKMRLESVKIGGLLMVEILENTRTPTLLLTSSSSLLLPYSSSSFLPSFHTLSSASASLLRSGFILLNKRVWKLLFLFVGIVEVGLLTPPVYYAVLVPFLCRIACSINKLPTLVACGFLTYLPRFVGVSLN